MVITLYITDKNGTRCGHAEINKDRFNSANNKVDFVAEEMKPLINEMLEMKKENNNDV